MNIGHERPEPLRGAQPRLDCRSGTVGPGPLNAKVTCLKAHWHTEQEGGFCPWMDLGDRNTSAPRKAKNTWRNTGRSTVLRTWREW